MTVKKIYACSECGAERKDANHWFVYTRGASSLVFHTWEGAAIGNMLDDGKFGHLCGQKCAHKLLDEFLNGNQRS